MMPRLDSSLAWKTATRLVSNNREVLMAIAGVFFLLPGLIGAVVLPRPEFGKGMTDQQMAETILQFYGDALPVLLALSIPLMLGFMVMLKVMLDPARPTVGSAIRRCLRLLPSYLGAHILSTLSLSMFWLLMVAVLSSILSPVVAVLFSLIVLTVPASRLVLVTPEIIVSEVLNPLRAVANSVQGTRGNYGRILSYFGPALVLFMVIYGLTMIFVGVILDQTTDGDVKHLLGEGIIGVLFAAGYTYLAAMVGSVWLQLMAPKQAA